MKRTLITVLVTALVTSACWYGASVTNDMRRAAERLWLMSAVKAPGRMALDDLDADLAAGRCETAQAKIAVWRQQWAVFNREAGFRGEAIGDIMLRFRQIDASSGTSATAEPGRAATGNRPSRGATNRPLPVVGSRR